VARGPETGLTPPFGSALATTFTGSWLVVPSCSEGPNTSRRRFDTHSNATCSAMRSWTPSRGRWPTATSAGPQEVSE
jgi:hypothetical protein